MIQVPHDISYRSMLIIVRISFFLLVPSFISAQPVSREATTAYRQKTYRNIVQHSIQKNLSLPLSNETEEAWRDAMTAMIFLQYQSDWTNLKIREAFQSYSSVPARLFIPIFEYLYAINIKGYGKWAYTLLQQQTDPTYIGIITQYLRSVDAGDASFPDIIKTINRNTNERKNDPIIESIQNQIQTRGKAQQLPIHEFFLPDYLPGQVFLLCLLRENRNYPGLCLIRDTAGHWIKDSAGNLISIKILARSQNNLPGYLPNGNTPQGLFRLDGYGQSKSGFIGPSTNIQLTMPFEYKAGHFFRDSTLSDSSWSLEAYRRLLPSGMRNHDPAYQSYLAGKAGRREIIIHGSTVDQGWYRAFPFYPLTPTQGCLTTYENWDPESGIRKESDQQKLVDLINQAGGPNGYVMLLDIDDRSAPVSLDEIMSILSRADIQ